MVYRIVLERGDDLLDDHVVTVLGGSEHLFLLGAVATRGIERPNAADNQPALDVVGCAMRR